MRMDIVLLKELLSEINTPSYLFDVDEFEARARLVKERFGENVGLCFSIKANPFLLGSLPDIFDKIEVCSPGELTICEKTGADPEKIIFSGVNKTAEDVERAMEDAVGTFTAESFLHAELINECAVRHGKKVPVLVRVTGGSQFGMDEADVIDLLRRREEYAGIAFEGLHYFTGTQKRKPAAIEKELDHICAFADRLKEEAGFSVKRLEYGTGLAADYFKDDADAEEADRLAAISAKVRETAKRFDLTIEMGRFFAAPCGYYFSRVMDVKTNCGINYAILDGGLHQLKYDGQIQGMQIPRILQIKERADASSGMEKWTLCGSLCTTADVLARDVEFDSLQIGDTLVFCRTGAYSVTEGMAAFLSRELPAVALYQKTKGLNTVRGLVCTDQFNTP